MWRAPVASHWVEEDVFQGMAQILMFLEEEKKKTNFLLHPSARPWKNWIHLWTHKKKYRIISETWDVCCRWVSKVTGWTGRASVFLLIIASDPGQWRGCGAPTVAKAAVFWSITFLRDSLIKSCRRRFRMSIWNHLKEHGTLWEAAGGWERLWIMLWMDDGTTSSGLPSQPHLP